ncbi:hypothetical protein [Mycobacterium shimoidei]|uniref:hypothetical protein n=1 Tax=Mycobacterium shimoidei TaxID=29313 RepID=UPI0015F01680|nr:hypothetical protein [Mycobacterium shimoidei]
MTLKELLEWAPEIADLASATRGLAVNHTNSAEFLHGLTKVSTWEGHGGDAARTSMAATAGDHYEAAQNFGLAALGMEHAHQEADNLADEIKGILNDADERPSVEINTSTNEVIPPNTDSLDEEAAASVAAKVTNLQERVAAALAKSEQVDADLARAIVIATQGPDSAAARDLTTTDGGAAAYPAPTARSGEQPPKDGQSQAMAADGGAAQLPATPVPANGQLPQQGAVPSPQAMDTHISNLGDAIDKSAGTAAQYAAIPRQSAGLGPTQGQLNRAAARGSEIWEDVSKVGKRLGYTGYILEGANGVNEAKNEVSEGKPVGDAVVDVAPKTAGSIAGGFVGAATGAEYGAGIGAAAGTVVPGIGTAAGAAVGAGIGAIVGGIAGSEVGKSMGETVSKGWHAAFDD